MEFIHKTRQYWRTIPQTKYFRSRIIPDCLFYRSDTTWHSKPYIPTAFRFYPIAIAHVNDKAVEKTNSYYCPVTITALSDTNGSIVKYKEKIALYFEKVFKPDDSNTVTSSGLNFDRKQYRPTPILMLSISPRSWSTKVYREVNIWPGNNGNISEKNQNRIFERLLRIYKNIFPTNFNPVICLKTVLFYWGLCC